MTEPTRIIAVVSFRHSGSTLLGAVLGASQSATFVGETDRVLRRRHQGPPRCRCRRSLAECERWAIDADEIAGWPEPRPEGGRWFGARHHLRRLTATRRDEVRVQRSLWRAAAEARGLALVDSSKDLRLLRRQLRDGHHRIDVVHLVRDPGPAVASSLRRGVESGRLSGRGRLVVTGLAELGRWTTLNVLAGPMLARRASSLRRVRLEDLGAAPEQTIGSLATALGIEPPVFDGRAVVAEEAHMIRANRSVTGGRIEIRAAGGSVDGLPPVVRALCGVADRATRRLRRPERRAAGHSGRTDAPLRDQSAGVGSHT